MALDFLDPGAVSAAPNRRRRFGGPMYEFDDDFEEQPGGSPLDIFDRATDFDPTGKTRGVMKALDYLLRQLPASAISNIGAWTGGGDALPFLGSEKVDWGKALTGLGRASERVLSGPNAKPWRPEEAEEAGNALRGGAAVAGGLLTAPLLTASAFAGEIDRVTDNDRYTRNIRRGRESLPSGSIGATAVEFGVPEIPGLGPVAAAVQGVRGARGASRAYRVEQAIHRVEQLVQEGKSSKAALDAVEAEFPQVTIGDVALGFSERRNPAAGGGSYVQEGTGISRRVVTPDAPSGTSQAVPIGGGARSARVTGQIGESPETYGAPQTYRTSYEMPDEAPVRMDRTPRPDDVDDLSGMTRADAEEIVERGVGQIQVSSEVSGTNTVRRAREALARMDESPGRPVPEAPGQKRLFNRLPEGRYSDLGLLRAPGPEDWDPITSMTRQQAVADLRPTIIARGMNRAEVMNLFHDRQRARTTLRNLGAESTPYRLGTNDPETQKAVTLSEGRLRQYGDDDEMPMGREVGRPSDTVLHKYMGTAKSAANDSDEYDAIHGFVPEGEVFDAEEQVRYIDRWQDGRLATSGEHVPMYSSLATEFSVVRSGDQPNGGVYLMAREKRPSGGAQGDWEFAGVYSDGGSGHTYLGLVDDFKGQGAGPRFLIAAQRLLGRATEGRTYSEQGWANRQRAHRIDVEKRARERLTNQDEWETARARAFGEIGANDAVPPGPPIHPNVMREYPDLFKREDIDPVLDYFAKVEGNPGASFSWRYTVNPESIPGMTAWSLGKGLPGTWIDRLKKAGYRFYMDEEGSLDLSFGGRVDPFGTRRSRLLIAPGGRSNFAVKADQILAKPPEGVESVPTSAEKMALEGVTGKRSYNSTSAVITSAGRWYHAPTGEHHSDWLMSLGLGGRPGSMPIDEELGTFGLIRVYRSGTVYAVNVAGQPTSAQMDQLKRFFDNLDFTGERAAEGRSGQDTIAWEVLEEVMDSKGKTGVMRTAKAPDGTAMYGGYSGSDGSDLLQALGYQRPVKRLRQQLLKPGFGAEAIHQTTPSFTRFAEEEGIKFDGSPTVGYGFTAKWGDEYDIDVVVRGDPADVDAYAVRMAREWDRESVITVHYGRGGDTPVASLRFDKVFADDPEMVEMAKGLGFDGHISVKDGEITIVRPSDMTDDLFEIRLEEFTSSPVVADFGFARPSVERAKVVHYWRDEQTAAQYDIQHPRFYDDALKGRPSGAAAGGDNGASAQPGGVGGGRPAPGSAGREGTRGRAGAQPGDLPDPEGRTAGVDARGGPHQFGQILAEQRFLNILRDTRTRHGMDKRERTFLPGPSRPYDINENITHAGKPEDVRRALHNDDVAAMERFLGPLLPSEREILAIRWNLDPEAMGLYPRNDLSPSTLRRRMIAEVEGLEHRLHRNLEAEELAGIARRFGVSIPRRFMGLRRFVSGEGGDLVRAPQAPPASVWDDLTPAEQMGAARNAAVRLVELSRQGRPVRVTTRGEVYMGGNDRQFSTQMERLSNYPAGAEVWDPRVQALNAQGARLSDEIERVTSPISWEATEAAAAMIGKPAREVARNMLKHGVTTAEVEMVTSEIARLMDRVTEVSQRVATNPQAVSQKERLDAVMWMREADILRVSLEQTASEAGRTLNILRKRVNEELALAPDEREFRHLIGKVMGSTDPAKIDAALVNLLAVRGNPKAMYQMLRDLQKSTFWDKAFEYSQANILWAPATHLTNTLSGIIQTSLLASKIVTKGAAGTLVRTATLGKVNPESTLDDVVPFFQALMGGYLAASKHIPDILNGTAEIAAKYGGEDILRGGAIKGMKGEIIRTPFKLLTIGDAFQTIPMYSGVRRMEIHRLAKKAHPDAPAMRRQFIDGLEADITPERIRAGAVSTTGLEVHRRAWEIAEEFALHGKGPVLDHINALRRAGPAGGALRWILRFVNTPYNLTKLGIRHSPVGLLRLDKTGADRVQEAAVGGFFMWWAWSMMASDNATGLYPTNKAERDMWQAEGRGPLMVKVGDRWVSALVLGPMLIPYMLTAAAKSVHETNGTDASDAQVSETLGWLGRNFADQVPMLAGMRQINDLLSNPLSDQATNIVANLATSFIPAVSLLRAAERMADDYSRRPQGIGESIQAAIPILAKEGLPAFNLPAVPPVRDLFGRPVTASTGMAAIFPRSIADKPDPIINEWRRHMKEDPEFPGLQKVTDTIGSGPRAVKLSTQEFDQYQAIVGPARERALQIVMTSAAYAKADGPKQREMLRTVKENAERGARVSYAYNQVLTPGKSTSEISSGMWVGLNNSTTATDKAIFLDEVKQAEKRGSRQILTPEVLEEIKGQAHDLTVDQYAEGLGIWRKYQSLPPFRDVVVQALVRDLGEGGVKAIETHAATYRKLIDDAEKKGVKQPWINDTGVQTFYRTTNGGWLTRLYTPSGVLRESEQHPERDAIEKHPLWPKFRSGSRR